MAVKKIAFILNCAVMICLGLVQFAAAQNAAEQPLLINRLLASKTVTGAWQINPQESDNVLAKVQEKIAKMPEASQPTKEDAKRAELPTITISLFPPETLTLATEDGAKAITINEGFKDILMTRTVSTDGTPQVFRLSEGVNASVKGSQQGNRLTVETISPRGNKMYETYELANNGEKLRVTVRVEAPGAREMLTLHRVYDRATVELPVVTEGTDSY